MFSTYFIQDCTNLSSQNHIKNFYACIEARFFFSNGSHEIKWANLVQILRRFFIFILQTWYWKGHEIFSLSRPCFYCTDFHLCNVTQYRKYLDIETSINNRHYIKWSIVLHITKIRKIYQPVKKHPSYTLGRSSL